MNMKAIELGASGGLDRIKLVELPDPGVPDIGQLRVRIHGSSLNFHDLMVAKSDVPTSNGLIPMADGAGVVEAVGAGVTEFAAGDHVVSTFCPTWLSGPPEIADFSSVPGDGTDGYACEIAVRPATWFTKAPKGWSHAEAATLTTAGLTAWRALIGDGGLKAGDTVLTLGTGGVSIFALQIAKAMGATVISTSSSDQKLEALRKLGADHVINYRTVPDWGEAAFKLTGGVDHVIEVGGSGTLAQSVAAARVGGHVALIGVLTGFGGEVPTLPMLIKQIHLKGVVVGSRRQQQDMVKAMNATGIKPVIDRIFPIEALADAFRYEESGKHFGKICLEF